jgi:hypothetical protein
VPTVAEQGYPGFESVGWIGLAAPAKTPVAVLDKLNAEIQKMLASPEVKEKLQQLAFTPLGIARGFRGLHQGGNRQVVEGREGERRQGGLGEYSHRFRVRRGVGFFPGHSTREKTMKTRHLLIAGAFLLLSSTGVHAQPSPRVSETVACPPNCEVIVRVDSGCVIRYADPAELHMKKPGNTSDPPVPVRWKIYGPAEFKFAQGSGITFPAAKNGNKPSTFSGTPAAGREVVLTNKNPGTAITRWQYEINVTGKGSDTCKLDPTVVNDDGTIAYY